MLTPRLNFNFPYSIPNVYGNIELSSNGIFIIFIQIVNQIELNGAIVDFVLFRKSYDSAAVNGHN